MTVDDQISFWEMLGDIQKAFHSILPPSTVATQNCVYKKNVVKTYAITVVFVSVQIYLALQRFCLFCNWYTVLALYSFSRYLHYTMYVDIIHQQVDNFVYELDRIVKISATLKRSDVDKLAIEQVLVDRLKVGSSLYVQLYDMSVKVNSALGWSLIINLVHSYVQIFVDFFWLFQLIENGLLAYFFGIMVLREVFR